MGYSCSLKTAVTDCSEGTETPLMARSADSLLQLAKNKDLEPCSSGLLSESVQEQNIKLVKLLSSSVNWAC